MTALRAAQVAADKDSLHIPQVLLDLRVVQPQFLPYSVKPSRVAVLRAHGGDRIARQCEEQQEGQHADGEQRQNRRERSPEQESRHRPGYRDDRGSSAAGRASPNRLNAKRITKMITPGKKT